MTLTELADAVERSGPSQELNAEVFAAVFPDKVPSPIVESGYGWRFTGRIWWCETGEDERIPRQEIVPPYYTTILDAAMTLASEENVEVILFEAMMRCGQAKASFKKDLARFVTAASLRAMEAPNEQ